MVPTVDPAGHRIGGRSILDGVPRAGAAPSGLWDAVGRRRRGTESGRRYTVRSTITWPGSEASSKSRPATTAQRFELGLGYTDVDEIRPVDGVSMFPQSSKFWRASDAFFESASRSKGIGRTAWGYYEFSVWDQWVQRSRKPDRKKRKMDFQTWQQSRAKTPFLKDFRAVQTSRSTLNPNREVAVSMRMSGRSVANLSDIAGSVGPIVAGQMDTVLASIAFNAWRKWPWDTKLSKALLSLEYDTPSASIFEGSVHSNAWYTFYIKTRQNGLGGKQPHRVLIFQPTNTKIRAAAEAIAQQIQNYANGGKL
jgi:hypothetical protein